MLFKPWQISYCINVALFSLILFLVGFFPVKQKSGFSATEKDLPINLLNIRLQKENLYIPTVNKTVIMFIDAMRYDFIEGLMGSTNMPFVSQQLSKNNACLLKSRAHPPTVTMPRIKAITTGTVPNFIDIALNLGSDKIQEDNIIHQASKVRKIIFYGDDTWLNLYPKSFARKKGTSSFYVNDFTQVDDNVTREVKKELLNSDWDVMILHYLGLDHIGHLEGPKSVLVKPKLQEMDNIALMIYNYLEQYDKKENKSSLLLICGDHGMKDTGSHGGASLGEVLVPVITLGLNCPDYNKEEIFQINIASTLSVLWGLPIPADNVGFVITPLLHKYSLHQKLYIYYYNSLQVLNIFLQNGGNIKNDGYKLHSEAVMMHHDWLKNSTNFKAENIILVYQKCLQNLSKYLTNIMAQYDMPLLVVAIFIQLQVLIVIMMHFSAKIIKKKTILSATSMFVLIFLCHQAYYFNANTDTFLNNIYIATICCFITSVNMTLFVFSDFKIFNIKEIRELLETDLYFIFSGQIIFLLSLTTSSLIEEEHQIWYFLWTTICFLIGLHQKSFKIWLCIAFVHRILRKINQTGSKWSSLPDIAGWLNREDHSYLITFNVCFGLIFIYMCSLLRSSSYCNSMKYFKIVINTLTGITIVSIYLFKSCTSNNVLLFSYPKSRGLFEMQVFWFLFWLLFVVKLVYFIKDGLDFKKICNLFIVNLMLLESVLQRPCNILLLPFLFIISHFITEHTKYQVNVIIKSTLLHHWLGMVFFFYQGNSNSLSTIDVAAGYAGLADYNFWYVGILLYMHTYCGPILAYLLNLQGVISLRFQNIDVTTSLGVLILQHILHIVVYLIFVLLQRYHLFVWSVFSPKLLYLSSQTLLYTLLINCTQLLIMFYSTSKKCLINI
uniref:GPI ethanolamine phosphate transferase 2 C-terminal domain-containing protein n=1 Tax=Clastoptera arizonana TaxID=38151 RepID=A0A1B6DRI5_9HEMI